MKLTETILHKAALYPVVAFDVFDTLIKRDVARPTDLFALLGADFAKARIQAEAEARAAKSGEVTLAEIYARPCPDTTRRQNAPLRSPALCPTCRC